MINEFKKAREKLIKFAQKDNENCVKIIEPVAEL